MVVGLWLLACTPSPPERFLVLDRTDAGYEVVPRAIPWLDDPHTLDGALGVGSYGGGYTVDADGETSPWRDGAPLRLRFTVADDVAVPADEQTLVLWSFYHHLGAARGALGRLGHDLRGLYPFDGIAVSPVVASFDATGGENAAYAATFHRFVVLPEATREVPLTANVGVVRHELAHAWFASFGGFPGRELRGVNEGFADIVAILSLDDPYPIAASFPLPERDAATALVRYDEAMARLDDPYALGMCFAGFAWAIREATDDRRWALHSVVDAVSAWVGGVTERWRTRDPNVVWKVDPPPSWIGDELVRKVLAQRPEAADAVCEAWTARVGRDAATSAGCP